MATGSVEFHRIKIYSDDGNIKGYEKGRQALGEFPTLDKPALAAWRVSFSLMTRLEEYERYHSL